MINYLIQSIIIFGIFTLLYIVLFRQSKALKFRRFFILGIPLLSLWTPTIKGISFFSNTSNPIVYVSETINQINISDQFANIQENEFYVYDKLILFWGLISIILLLNLGVKISQILYLKYNSISRTDNVIYTSKNHNPFSFLKNIYISNQQKNKENIELIIQHENIHINQAHSLDILIYELLKIIFWFNPFLYILKSELIQVHEYLVDYEMTKDSREIEKYYHTILNNSILESINITNNFNNSFIKKRFIMMTKNKKPSYFKTAITFAIVVSTIFTSIQCNNSEINKEDQQSEENSDTTFDFKSLDKKPEFKDGNKALMKFLGENTQYPKFAKELGVSARCFISFVISAEGSVKDVSILRIEQAVDNAIKEGYSSEDIDKAIQELKDESIRVVSSMPKWTPGEKDGKKVNVKYIVPLNFKIQ